MRGEGGVGKTELAFYYVKSKGYRKVLKLIMAKRTADISSVEDEVVRWIKQDFGQEPSHSFQDNLEILRRILTQERQVAIIIDNLEPALDKTGRFIENHSSYVELLRVLADDDLCSITLITSRAKICEPSVKFCDYPLKGLDISAWRDYFGIKNDEKIPALKEMHRAYNGNAKAMGIHRGAIQQNFVDGKDIEAKHIEAYWKHYRDNLLAQPDLENLIAEQFENLKSLEPIAYKLLCRLGCYRYQDVPSVPYDGLNCLLWDEPEQTTRVVELLKNRSLIEIRELKFWLHPVIREEAIRRLNTSEDWQEANRQAANFFTNKQTNSMTGETPIPQEFLKRSNSIGAIESIGDALFILEAYYHFLEIRDYECAAAMIIQDRTSQYETFESRYETFESLGVALYRLGLSQKAIPLVEKLILEKENISPYLICRLYNTIGEFYLMAGDLQKAIRNHGLSGKIAESRIGKQEHQGFSRDPRRTYENLSIASDYNVGICNLELWEIDVARQYFEKVKGFTEDEKSWKPYVEGSRFLSDIYFPLLQGDSLNDEKKKQFRDLANTFPQDRANINPDIHCKFINFSNPWAYGFFGVMFGWVYRKLNEPENAESLYRSVAAETGKMNYTQFQANILNGLAELHRERKDFENAKKFHNQAIDLLKDINCKRDLAEAYFQ
ncbi:MAG TPA: tetratricopeptide repeat protein, partial [Methanosarcina sp.]|nr:tetratricopeptide repeat protein [Methanosarcina sp.]